jgi:hypothetical protein
LQRNDFGLTIPAVSLPQSSAGARNSIAAAAPPALGRVQGDPTSLPIAAQPMVMNPVLPLQFDRNVMSLLRTNGIAPEYGLVAENVMGGQGKVVEFERKGTTCDVGCGYGTSFHVGSRCFSCGLASRTFGIFAVTLDLE